MASHEISTGYHPQLVETRTLLLEPIVSQALLHIAVLVGNGMNEEGSPIKRTRAVDVNPNNGLIALVNTGRLPPLTAEDATLIGPDEEELMRTRQIDSENYILRIVEDADNQTVFLYKKSKRKHKLVAVELLPKNQEGWSNEAQKAFQEFNIDM